MKKTKMMRMNKKGATTKYVMLSMMRFILLAIVIFAMVLMFKTLIINDLRVTSLKSGVLYSRIIYSPTALSYVDEYTGRAYPGVIDLDKFTSDNLEDSIEYPYERHISARVSLRRVGGQTVNNLGPIYINKVWYENWEPLTHKSLTGWGTADKTIYTLPVIYEENSKFKNGIMTIMIIQPES